MIWLLVAQLWTSTNDGTALLQGNWQSCNGEERVYEHRVLGKFAFELHMGPGDEFALYRTHVDGEDHEHTGTDNLLGTAFRVNDYATNRGKRNWSIPTLKLWVSIVAAGGSRPECDSFFIKIMRRQ